MLNDQDFSEVIQQFPPIEFGFAYGSGVVEQGGYNYNNIINDSMSTKVSQDEKETNTDQQKAVIDESDLPMVDMIFAVEDPERWHSENLLRNPSHYTPLVTLSPHNIAYVQSAFGAGMWYNAMIAMNITKYPKRLMKYGVISQQKLIADLNDWKTLYAAGRLHKPVKIFKENLEINKALMSNRTCFEDLFIVNAREIQRNRPLLYNRFIVIYREIHKANIEYMCDPRMLIGENPKKIVNLVNPVVPQYRAMYADTLRLLSPELGLKTNFFNGKTFFKTNELAVRWKLTDALPLTMKRLLLIKDRKRFHRKIPPAAPAVRSALATIVARAASTQSLKGLFTVGLAKGCTYIASKIAKRILAPTKKPSFS